MPRVHQRKARKDYPKDGISKGDNYYYTSLKLQRGGLVKRSLKPFKPSQLTNSPFKSGWYSAEEEWNESSKDGEAMRAAAEAIREIGTDAQNSFDNMPDGLQQGDTGQQLENRATECERIADEIDSAADSWDDLEEPGDAPPEPDDDEAPDYAEKVGPWEEWTEATDEYATQTTCIQEEVDGLPGEMPD